MLARPERPGSGSPPRPRAGLPLGVRRRHLPGRGLGHRLRAPVALAIEHHEHREFPASAPERWGGSALFGRIAGSGSWGGQRPSLADYVTGMEPTGGAIADGRVLELATLRRPVVTLARPVPEIILGHRPYSLGRRRGACGHRDWPCSDPRLGCGRPASRA